jgi:hypothetical protein
LLVVYFCYYNILEKLYVTQWLVTVRWFSPGTPFCFTNKTDRHEITEILFKLAFNTKFICFNKITKIYFLIIYNFKYQINKLQQACQCSKLNVLFLSGILVRSFPMKMNSCWIKNTVVLILAALQFAAPYIIIW